MPQANNKNLFPSKKATKQFGNSHIIAVHKIYNDFNF